jgi:hypothetical protein
MSSVDDILYSPITVFKPWQELTHRVLEYFKNEPLSGQYLPHRKRPANTLSLIELMRLYHEEGQKQFYVVMTQKDMALLEFNGILSLNDWHYPTLNSPDGRSIRDLNLVLNTYNDIFVFANTADARLYQASM